MPKSQYEYTLKLVDIVTRIQLLYNNLEKYYEIDNTYKQKAVQLKEEYYGTSNNCMMTMALCATYACASTASATTSSSTSLLANASTTASNSISTSSTTSKSTASVTSYTSSTTKTNLTAASGYVSSTTQSRIISTTVKSYNGISYTTVKKTTTSSISSTRKKLTDGLYALSNGIIENMVDVLTMGQSRKVENFLFDVLDCAISYTPYKQAVKTASGGISYTTVNNKNKINLNTSYLSKNLLFTNYIQRQLILYQAYLILFWGLIVILRR